MSERTLFGTNGIRGVVNNEMTPELAVKVGCAIGTYFDRARILLGYDVRTSSTFISAAVASGLISTGCIVYDVGLAPTPAIQFAVKNMNMDGAVIITASHNPPEYNGIKVVGKDGVEVTREEEMKIERFFFEDSFNRSSWKELGTLQPLQGILEPYMEAVKSHVDVSSICKKHFKVVVDPANSVGALVTPRLLRDLGCEVFTLNGNLDGHFPGRLPEPRPETLGALSRTVKALGADLGIAHDGDADRCMFVDERGEVVLGDMAGSVILDYVLSMNPNATVVTPISSSKMVEDVVLERGGYLIWTEVGSTTVTRRMIEVKSLISLEDNGGIFYGPHQPVRDGAMTAALMLEILVKSGKPLSQLVDRLPKYSIIKERVEVPNERKQRVLQGILHETSGYKRLTIDGVKIFFDDASLLVRPSGTEAIYRVFAEAKDDKRARELAEWGIRLIKNYL